MNKELFQSYQRKVKSGLHSQITDDERLANKEYHREVRANWTEEEKQKRGLSSQKSKLRRKLKILADKAAIEEAKKMTKEITKELL